MGLLIADGVAGSPARLGDTFDAFVQRVYRPRSARLGVRLPALTASDDSVPLVAEVDANRWIVRCPDCTGAEFAWRAGPHLFMCAGCWNGRVNHAWRRYTFPAEQSAIEEVLMGRFVPETRNWRPHETVEDLRIENLTNGVPLKAAY